MAKRISGITVEIGGDTTKLGKALKDVNSQSKSINSELREVNRLLKFEPSNTVLLEQKQKLLADSIANTKDKLETLKEAERQVQEQVQNGGSEEAYRALQREVVKTESQLKSLEQQSKELGNELSRSLDQASKKMESFGKAANDAGMAMMPISAAAIAAGTAGVITFTNFDDAMRQVQATMNGTQEDLERLTDTAKQMGAETRFSATESANALNYLALAGYDADKAIETLPKVLRLAAAGNLDLAYATDLVTDSMSALGKDVEQVDEFIDKMAKTSQQSNTNVAQLGEATLVVAGQAGLAKMELTDLNASLGILADNGIKGSEGGTALRNVLKSLLSPTNQGKAAMEELGVSMFDMDGNVRNLQEVLQELDTSLSSLTDEERAEKMGDIFDSRSVSAVNALLKDCGERWDELADSIDNAEGTAQTMSDTMEGGIGGAFRELKSGTEAMAIAIGETLAPMVEGLARHLKSATEWFVNLSDWQKEFIVGVGLFLAAVGPVLIFVGKLSTGISSMLALGSTLAKLNLGAKVSGAMGLVTKGVGLLSKALAFLAANPVVLIIGLVAALVAGLIYLWNTNENFRDAVIAIWEKVKAGILFAVEALVSFFTEILPGVVDTVIEFFTVKIPEAFFMFLNFMKELPGRLWELLLLACQKLAQWHIDVAIMAKDTALSFLSKFTEFFRNLPEKLWELLLLACQKLAQWHIDIAIMARDAATSFLNKFMEFFGGLPDRIKQKVADALEKIKDWGSNIKDWAANILPTIVTSIVEKFGELPGKLLSIGEDAIAGLWEGIANKVGWITDKISGFCTGLIQGFKDNFQIQSPSRIMKGVGGNIVEGISVGMEEAEEQPLKRAAYVSDQIISRVATAARGSKSALQRESPVAASSVDNRKQVTNHYTFHSPVPLTPAETRRQMKKAQKELLLGV